jgi:hypothetical protein
MLGGTEIPLERNSESENSLIPATTGSVATPETMLENSQLIAFFPIPTYSVTAVLTDVGGGADSPVESANSNGPELVGQITISGGAGDTEEDTSVLTPRSQGVLADLFPVNLTSLEADIQTLLEQVEQLGAELSSMLGRMNLSPLLMAVAITALAGEIARRGLHRPQAGPLLGSGGDAAAGWLPGLTDPWSTENL